MMPISTKLTLLVLVLPTSFLLSFYFVIFYYYKVTIEINALISAINTFVSVILVLLLVWERLRDSLSKKFEYLHKNFLFNLYSRFDTGLWFNVPQDDVERLRNDLKTYGKFMIFLLYPRNLMKKIDEFLSLHKEFYKRYKNISELAEKQNKKSHSNMEIISYFIGLDISPNPKAFQPTSEEEQYKVLAQNIVKEYPQLISETKSLIEKIRPARKQIHDELEDFLKSNNLRLKEEIEYNPLYRL